MGRALAWVAVGLCLVGCVPAKKQAAEWDVPANWGKNEVLVTTEYESLKPIEWGFRVENDQQRRPHVIAYLAIPILAAPPGRYTYPVDDLHVYAIVADDKGRMLNEAAIPTVLNEIRPGNQGKAVVDLGELPADSKRVLLRWMRHKSDTWRPVYWTLDIPADRTPKP